MQTLNYNALADILLGITVAVALAVLAITLLSGCAYDEADLPVEHWSQRDVPSKE